MYSDLEYNHNFCTINGGVQLQEIESFKLNNTKDMLRRKYGYSSKDKIITLIGTFTERKGQHVFAEAARKLLENYDHKLQFLMVGAKNDEYTKKIKRIVTKSKYFLNIRIIPETNQIFDYYRISDLFINCSFVESFPRVILEYMAFNSPIISTNVNGIAEQLKNEINGILIPPNDPSMLAEKIKLILENKTLGESLANQAYQRLQTHFTQAKMISNHLKLIQDVCTLPIKVSV